MKEVQMTFRVEQELRTRFTEAAELDHRPASQVLRELMRRYVDQPRVRAVGIPTNDLIDPAESRRRLEATDFARASVGLEGFMLTMEDEEQTRRFVSGEIELAEFVKAE